MNSMVPQPNNSNALARPQQNMGMLPQHSQFLYANNNLRKSLEKPLTQAQGKSLMIDLVK